MGQIYSCPLQAHQDLCRSAERKAGLGFFALYPLFSFTILRPVNWQRSGILLLGPGWLLLAQALPLPGLMPSMVGVVLWMLTWWVTTVVPIGVTALLPMVLYPLLGIAPLGGNHR